MLIWYRCQNRIEKYYHHDGEKLCFYKKYISQHTQAEQKEGVLEIFVFQETKNFHLFDKNHSQDNVKCHIQNEESWLRRIVIELVNYK